MPSKDRLSSYIYFSKNTCQLPSENYGCTYNTLTNKGLPIQYPGLCGYLLLLMGLFWCTECLPLGVTSLIPVILVPTFGFMTTKEVCPLYFEAINMMLTGGLIVALAIERCNLHKRIALRVLLLIGVSPRWLLLGFMLPTWFLSMWISNTATSAMMMPVVLEVIKQIESVKKPDAIEPQEKDESHSNPISDKITAQTDPSTPTLGVYVVCKMEPTRDYFTGGVVAISSQADLVPELNGSSYSLSSADIATEDEEASLSDNRAKNASPLAKALVISIAFSANSGGIGTLIGTTCNLICKNHADKLWEEKLGTESPINFATWMGFGIPISFINLLIIWLWLEVYFIGPREFFGCGAKRDETQDKAVRDVIKKEYNRLGRISIAEIQVCIIFLLLVLLWFFRKPDFIPGWAALFKKGYAGDAVPAILMAVLVFALHSSYPRNVRKGERPYNLMDWQMITDKFPWSVILLLGGGFALAEAAQRSDLSDLLGDLLTVIEALPGPVIIIIITYGVTLLTQITSNTASAILMMPIVASLSMKLNYNPLYLMLPVTIGTQLAFMLPVATPPNAVAFTSGLLTVMDLVKAGAILNVLLTFVATGATLGWGMVMFDLSTLPWDYTPVNGTNSSAYIMVQYMSLRDMNL